MCQNNKYNAFSELRISAVWVGPSQFAIQFMEHSNSGKQQLRFHFQFIEAFIYSVFLGIIFEFAV